jgi:hypothetical protein
MNDIEFEPLTSEEIEEVVGLYRKAMVPIWEEAGIKYSLDRLQRNLITAFSSDDRLFTIKDDEIIVAFIWTKEREDLFENKYHDIVALVVDPRYQHLVDSILRKEEAYCRSKTINNLLLRVHPEEDSLLSIYDNLGFREYHRTLQKSV